MDLSAAPTEPSSDEAGHRPAENRAADDRSDDDRAADDRASDDLLLGLLGLLALAGLGYGLSLLVHGPMGFGLGGVVRGIAGQLTVTLPAAVLTLAAAGLNLASGAVAARAIRRSPFTNFADAILTGFVGAVLVDFTLLAALGGVGLFTRPVVLAVNALVVIAGWRVRPLVRRKDREPGSPRGWRPRLTPGVAMWAFIAIAWAGPVILQLASPVVPFIDVLPNHVAPAEHVRAFGAFSPLTTTASPIYGPSRTFLGYVALLSTVTVITGLPAALSVAAFVLPATVLVALAMWRLAAGVGGRSIGFWMLVTFALTTSFARLADDRATVTVLPLVGWSLATLADWMRTSQLSEKPAVGAPRRTPEFGRMLLFTGGLAATILVHPVIGALTALTVAFVVLAMPRRAESLAIPGLAGAAVLASPQAGIMLGLAIPAPVALLAIAPAVGIAWVFAHSRAARQALVALGRVGVAGLVVAALVVVGPVEIALGAISSVGSIVESMPLLLAATAVGLVLAWRRIATPIVIAGLAAGAVAATATQVAPDQGLLLQAIRFEVPKTLQYWVPVFVAVTAATGLDALWTAVTLGSTSRPPPKPSWALSRVPRPAATAALGVFLLAAVLPFRPTPIDLYYLGEHRVSETLAIDLRYAERGYWVGYPDPRTIVTSDQTALIETLRAEVAAGRLHADTDVLHVANSFQQWAATPLGVFAGVIETDAVLDPEVSIHTVGGRLFPVGDLERLLATQRYGYVVWEPDGLSSDLRDKIVAAGYRSIFANTRGEVFIRT